MKNTDEFKKEVGDILASLNEGVAMHGGNIVLVDADVTTGRVSVRMEGACVDCPMSEWTLKAGLEETLREAIPEVREVVQVE